MVSLGGAALALALGPLIIVLISLLAALEAAIRPIPVIGGPLADALQTIDSVLIGGLRDLLGSAMGLLLDLLHKLYEGVRDLLDSIEAHTTFVYQAISWLLHGGIAEIVKRVIGELGDLASKAWSLAQQVWNDLQKLAAHVEEIVLWVQGELDRLPNEILQLVERDLIQPVWHKITEIESSIQDYVIKEIEKLPGQIEDIANKLLAEVLDRLKAVEDALKNLPIVQDILKLIEAVWPWLASENVILFLKWIWKIDREILSLIDPATWLGFNPGIGAELGKNLARSGSGFESVLRDIYGVKRRV